MLFLCKLAASHSVEQTHAQTRVSNETGSLVSWDKGTKVSLFSRDKETMGQDQNLYTGRARTKFWHFAKGRIGMDQDGILTFCQWTGFWQPVPEYYGTATGKKEKKSKRITIKKKIGKIFDSCWCFFDLEHPGTEKFVTEFLMLLLSQNRGTAGQGNFFVPRQKDGGTRKFFCGDIPSLGNSSPNIRIYWNHKSWFQKEFELIVHCHT